MRLDSARGSYRIRRVAGSAKGLAHARLTLQSYQTFRMAGCLLVEVAWRCAPRFRRAHRIPGRAGNSASRATAGDRGHDCHVVLVPPRRGNRLRVGAQVEQRVMATHEGPERSFRLRHRIAQDLVRRRMAELACTVPPMTPETRQKEPPPLRAGAVGPRETAEQPPIPAARPVACDAGRLRPQGCEEPSPVGAGSGPVRWRSC